MQVNGISNDYYAPVINGWGFDQVITNGANVNALVNVNRMVIGRRNLQSLYDSVRLNYQGIQNTARLSEQDLIQTIVGQYITTFGDWEQYVFTKQVYDLLEKEDEILKILTQKNVYKQTDYLTFLVTLRQQKSAMKQARIQYEFDYTTLLYLSGITDTTLFQLAEPTLLVKDLPGMDSSVFFQQYVLDSLRNLNQREIIAFSYRPKLNVFTEGGYNSSLSRYAYKHFGFNFGLGLTVPIYDGRQRRMKYEKIDIAERTRQAYRAFFTEQYHRQIEQLKTQLQKTSELIEEINEEVKYSSGLIEANLKLLRTGDVRVSDLVIAINNYMNTMNLLTQNKTTRRQIINQLNYWYR